MKVVIVVILFSIFLLGCTTGAPSTDSDPGPYPKAYEELVTKWLQNNLFDPYSVRDLEIAAPSKGTVWRGLLRGGHLSAWNVCASFQAKNRLGGYVGKRTTVLFIRHDVIVASERYEQNGLSRYRCLF